MCPGCHLGGAIMTLVKEILGQQLQNAVCTDIICDVIKQNQSEVGNIDFDIAK